MTSKLYYTDPLIAAYMFEHFDVHYIDEFKLEFIWGKSTTGLYPVAPEKIFIADNFLHIFEPQEGDIGEDEDGFKCVFERDNWGIYDNGVRLYYYLFNEMEPLEIEGSVMIIKRQGKAFFMPEVSNDQ